MNESFIVVVQFCGFQGFSGLCYCVATTKSWVYFLELNRQGVRRSLLAEVTRYVRLPEAVQVEEALGEALGRGNVGTVAAVGEGVATAQAQPVTEVLVQLWICG